MKKRMLLCLLAFALAATALVSAPASAGGGGLLCPRGPECWVGPQCCSDLGCAGFCENLNPGSVPHCSGDATESGCCSCDFDNGGV
jgi:hypothetical protein